MNVSICQQQITVKEYRDQRVVTLKDIDLVHNRPEGTASRNFNANRKHLIEGVDYFHICYEELRSTNFVERPNPQGINLLTESGYLMLVKSFTDDLAWEVQRALVEHYFHADRETQLPAAVPPKVLPKYWKGQPVLSLDDAAALLSCSRDTVVRYMNRLKLTDPEERLLLSGADLFAYKRENLSAPRGSAKVRLITRRGFMKLRSYLAPNCPVPDYLTAQWPSVQHTESPQRKVYYDLSKDPDFVRQTECIISQLEAMKDTVYTLLPVCHTATQIKVHFEELAESAALCVSNLLALSRYELSDAVLADVLPYHTSSRK